MVDYCVRDVEVNVQLWNLFSLWGDKIPDAVEVEHKFFTALESQMNIGWHIDEDAAYSLLRTLSLEKQDMEEDLLDLFDARIVPATHIKNKQGSPKWIPNPQTEPSNLWWNPKPLKTKTKVYPFKPSSAKQVVWNLNKKYGWVPKQFTDKGNPKFDEEVISSLPFEETKNLVRYSQVCSRISELIGDSGYLTLLGDDSRIHGNIRHCGAVTHRCTHQRPNAGNVTGVTNRTGVPQLYGHEMRSLWTVPSDDYVIVGADASGLELRMLGNRMAPFDDGAYAKEVVEGDAHAKNAEAAMLYKWYPKDFYESDEDYKKRLRSASKPIIYAMNYGAANERLGECLVPKGETWTSSKLKSTGAAVRKNLMEGIPALKKLIDSLKSNWKPGIVLTGLDGRVAENRAAYQSLNTLLQMDGAIVMKWATTIIHDDANLMWGEPAVDGIWCMVGHVHDEYQFQVRKEIADEFGKRAIRAIREAGQRLSVCCRLDGEYKIGRTWADTH
jgi:DNA polymerase I-like protein with 3'-5' exonuclease and polymerase domains